VKKPVKLPATLSQQSNARKPLSNNELNTTFVLPFDSQISLTKPGGQSKDRVVGFESEDSSTTSRVILPPPQQMSTPKSKESLVQDRAETKSEETTTDGELQVDQVISIGQSIDLNPSSHQVNDTCSEVLYMKEKLSAESHLGEEQDAEAAFQSISKPAKVTSENILKHKRGPKHVKIVTSISTGPELNSVQGSKVSIKHRPPRAPSRLLQRSISQKSSSSSELSDDSSHSDDSEGRDKFDPGKVFHDVFCALVDCCYAVCCRYVPA